MSKGAGRPPTRGASRLDMPRPARHHGRVNARVRKDESEDWARLGAYVVSRRTELGHDRQQDLADAAGVAVRTIGALERGERVRASTVAKIERALDWLPGSASTVLHGGEPDTKDANAEELHFDDPAEVAIWNLAELDRATRLDLILHLRGRRQDRATG